MSAAAASNDGGTDLRSRALYAMRHQVRSADQIDAFRRWSAQNLAQSLGLAGAEHLHHPLSLVEANTDLTGGASLDDPEGQVGSSQEKLLTPAQREYVAEARRNVGLRAQLAELVDRSRDASDGHPKHEQDDEAKRGSGEDQGSEKPNDAVQALELQADIAALERQIQRAELAHRCLDSLEQLPAASPDFLDPAVMFRGCSQLPQLPRELMDSFTRTGGGAAAAAGPPADVEELVRRLKRENLRHKMLAQKARQDADAGRARCRDAAQLLPSVQLHALASVKNALIGWIETQLGQAGGEEEEGYDEDGSPRKRTASQQHTQAGLDAQLADIRLEYDAHIALRREIMALVARAKRLAKEQQAASEEGRQDQRDAASGQPHGPTRSQQVSAAATAAAPPKPDAEAFLITPFVEQLQILQREQKSLIQEKSHINGLLARQQEDTCQLLGHLADESQLLPRFPAAAKQVARDRQQQRQEQEQERQRQQQHGLGEAAPASSKRKSPAAATRHADIARQVEPWLAASDAAKLATLEAVAERVEEGQVAVDHAMEALGEVCRLLDKEHLLVPVGPEDDDQDLSPGSGAASPPRRVAAKKGEAKLNHTTIWSKLDGNLGLINE